MLPAHTEAYDTEFERAGNADAWPAAHPGNLEHLQFVQDRRPCVQTSPKFALSRQFIDSLPGRDSIFWTLPSLLAHGVAVAGRACKGELAV
jgi:hypothetical protein